jgi:hypothetical protein
MKHLTRVQSKCAGFILVLIVSLMACLPSESLSPPKPSAPVIAPPAPAASAQDAPKSAALQQNQKVILQDDFKDPNSGWTVFTNDFGEGKYQNGSYYLKCTQPAYHGGTASTTTTNAGLTSLTSFMLDMDVTMLSGSRDDYFGIILRWPDINPSGIEGYEQPSDYYFFVAPEGMLAWCYSQQEVKGSSVDKIMPLGYFLRPSQYTCVRGANLVNNIKIWFNPGIRFMINDYELVNTPDRNLDYVNRLIKDKSMTGATVQVVANSEDVYSRPTFQLNRIIVYDNN